MITRLHLGCGKEHLDGYINCDISNKYKVDKIVDLEQPLPFETNSIDEIVTNHTLEHIKNFIPLMEEMYRVCKPNAIIKINVPYFCYVGSYVDPTHKRFFSLKTFDYFVRDSKLDLYDFKCNFKIIKKRLTFMSTRPKVSKLFDWFINSHQSFYERFLTGFLQCDNLYVELLVLK